MQNKIIDRKEEIRIFEGCFASNTPEFLAVYGRRRVGKTFLIRSFFENKKNIIFLDVTGMQDGTISEQIRNFMDATPDFRTFLIQRKFHPSFLEKLDKSMS